MTLLQILILACIQGAAELLPVSSSAHVIVAEKLLGLDPGAPQMTFLLVMLHTGTMFAVLAYFAKRWRVTIQTRGKSFLRAIVIATGVTGVLGLALKVLIEKLILEKYLGHSKGEVEELFRHLPLIAANLLFMGGLILFAARKQSRGNSSQSLSDPDATSIGCIQAICLPLRGFSRSGATISMSLLRSIPHELAEEFSFALAVILTPPVILLEAKRLFSSHHPETALSHTEMLALIQPGLVGMLFSFLAGLVALKWLSGWLEKGKWQYFGYYCVAASLAVAGLAAFTSG